MLQAYLAMSRDRSSLIKNGLLLQLSHDARVYDEFATTRLWEYLLREPFNKPEWVWASQQPPYDPKALRRVDLILEHIALDGSSSQKVLMMEAKKHGATEGEIRKCEGQAWEAAFDFSLNQKDQDLRPVWYQTCVGTTTRFWICNPTSDFPIQFLPGVFGLENLNEYIDIETYGNEIMDAFNYIRRHRVPPPKHLSQRPPSESSSGPSSEPPQSPSSAARTNLNIAAAARNPIPLHPNHWTYIEITHAKITEDDVIILVGSSKDGQLLETVEEDWRPQFIPSGNQRVGYFAYIEKKTQQVYWTWKLMPPEEALSQAGVQQNPRAFKGTEAGPSSQSQVQQQTAQISDVEMEEADIAGPSARDKQDKP